VQPKVQYLQDVLAERVARTKEFMAEFKGFMDSMPVIPPHNKE